MSPWWLGAIVTVVAGCDGAASSAPPAAARPRPAVQSELAPAGGCGSDDDCELVPELTCCDECAPVPPFQSVPRSTIDTLLLESEERCLHDDRACRPCARPPPGCTATARCRDGACTFDATGCERPNA